MSDHDEHLRNLSVAVGIVTAWRDREELGVDPLRDIVSMAVVERGPAQIVYALADLICGTLTAMDRTVGNILDDPAVLADALARSVRADPLRPADVDLDSVAVLARIGSWAASVQP